ncbi:hypothetical protein BTM25_20960 [Actinomadura rubteroloni]|uniref:Uncharacterized protein n=1 Tax=Actinomadura rubteroloni TaxID=1926885 RepID=A0A2P4URK0_9ACTN|nr:hypothetical protein BTM25_20960 [Actinomadura rubteroloni]
MRNITVHPPEHLTPASIDTEHPRHPIEPGTLQKPQQPMNRRRMRPHRPPHRVPDPHHAFRDVTPGKRHLTVHRHRDRR